MSSAILPEAGSAARAEVRKATAQDGLFAFIWRNSRKEQIVILAIVLVSMPFYFASLDLPKSIVNDAIQGRAFPDGKLLANVLHIHLTLPQFLGGGLLYDFPGIAVSRLVYLAVLSGLFLALVLVNGAFKYVINMRKGKLGERVLRTLRMGLFAQVLGLAPEAARNVKASEVATIIKDEVEPIGGFTGEAFVQPVFLAGQALTALIYILLQSPSLGLLTVAMVGVQGFIVPRLRREQLRLGRMRQLQSRALAGRIGEVVDGLGEVANHGAGAYERQRIAGLLDQLFWVRYRLYGRKFMAKFINNLLAQITPFLFYLIGGFYALAGTLDIGQLVAVIGAYRDLPPPLKELIDWDQQRQDVAVKYDQVMEQFSGAAPLSQTQTEVPSLAQGLIETQALRVAGAGGEALLERASLSLPLGSAIALCALSGNGASVLAQVIGRRIAAYSGAVRIAGHDLATLPVAALGRRMAYAGPEATVFQGSIRDNVLYGLRLAPKDATDTISPERADGPARDASAIDYPAAGAADAEEIDARIIAALFAVGMDDAVYRLGLASTIDPKRQSDLATRLVAARRAVNERLTAEGARGLIESFEPALFNVNATIGENLLFGVAHSSAFADEKLAGHPLVRPILDATGLTALLDEMGRKIAATMVEIFQGVSADHYLFEQFSFIQPDDLPACKEALARAGGQRNESDAAQFIGLSLRYVEPRHRLGLLTRDLSQRMLQARAAFMATPAADIRGDIEFYDPDRYCAAAPLRDNLLFGRIAHGTRDAAARVLETVRKLLQEQNLEREVFRLGLDHPTGPGGRLLQPADRSAIALARSLIKRPEILVLNQPFGAFSEAEARILLARIRAFTAGATLIAVTRDPALARTFDYVVEVDNARVKWAGPAGETAADTAPAAEPFEDADGEHDELQALRAVPAFANVDPARLKLIAFTSERLRFGPADLMFEQGRPSDSAYVLLSGTADVWLETPEGRIHLAKIGKNAITGEMGVISGAPRSATVIATSDVTALRLSKEVFMSLLAEFPQISLSVMRDQISRIVVAQSRLGGGSAPRAAAGDGET